MDEKIEADPDFEAPSFGGHPAHRSGNDTCIPGDLSDQPVFDAGDFIYSGTRSVCGGDDRALVSATQELPWRLVCQLLIEGLYGVTILGTGWLAGPNTIFTAAHNILDPAKGQRARRIWVFPGRTRNSAPYGYTSSTDFAVHPDWASSLKPTEDIGVIYLDEALGNKLGWFGFANWSDAKLSKLIVNNAGYAVDKTFATMWSNGGRIMAVEPGTLAYALDTEGGQSGSPIFVVDGAGKRTVVAVHAYGRCPRNFGIRINETIYNLLKGWLR